MADSVKFAVSVTPVEELTDEQGNVHSVIAGEVGKSLGGNGSAVVVDFSDTAVKQGYLNATVNYLECVDNSSTQISAETTASFVFIKNTGYLFSSATVLGAALASHSVVVTTINTGTTVIACLAAGEAIVLKSILTNSQQIDCTKIKVQVFEADGSAAGAADHLAVEYLVVD